mmetsp:Transcript_89861/g.155560  ORF Transcript_89861/g.155560 Transcript_89861/m.155560 type:complete len:240 (+) Transcript_89861:858-1577(+)
MQAHTAHVLDFLLGLSAPDRSLQSCCSPVPLSLLQIITLANGSLFPPLIATVPALYLDGSINARLGRVPLLLLRQGDLVGFPTAHSSLNRHSCAKELFFMVLRLPPRQLAARTFLDRCGCLIELAQVLSDEQAHSMALDDHCSIVAAHHQPHKKTAHVFLDGGRSLVPLCTPDMVRLPNSLDFRGSGILPNHSLLVLSFVLCMSSPSSLNLLGSPLAHELCLRLGNFLAPFFLCLISSR